MQKLKQSKAKQCAINCNITCTLAKRHIPRLVRNISLHMMTKQLQAQMFNKSCELMCSIPSEIVCCSNIVWFHFSALNVSKWGAENGEWWKIFWLNSICISVIISRLVWHRPNASKNMPKSIGCSITNCW